MKCLLTSSSVPVTKIVSLASRKKNQTKMIITLLFSSVIASVAIRVTGLGGISKLLHEIISIFDVILEMKKRKRSGKPFV
ncbi:hypothetical protein Bca4012_058616 [Brassica carinata]|uniref:Uncharacterized protein n=1 Tax=Brassica carinata TaxID=52824 RepID=A0A8X7W499_BRACI|nr:hypothetical protein Bca52824_016344 [Brassica carinata]